MSRKITTESVVLGFMTGCLFLALGALALFKARRIQRLALDYYARNPDVARLNFFTRYMATEAYVRVTQIIGFIASVAGGACIFLVLKGYFGAG